MFSNSGFFRLPFVVVVMKIKSLLFLVWSLLFFVCVLSVDLTHSSERSKIAVFNFTILNLDAKGYDATITNTLITFLERAPSLIIINRRELEAFLSLNDLQQNEDLPNVITVGNRLGLDLVVVANVRKRGPVIEITCRIAKIADKSFIYERQFRSLEAAGLRNETEKMSLDIVRAIESNKGRAPSPAPQVKCLRAPVNVLCRPGGSSIRLEWEDISAAPCDGYRIFRSQSEEGPFIKIAQVSERGYVDRGLDKDASYYYRIKAFDAGGRESNFSSTVQTELAMTPNPPIIMNAQGRVRCIEITCSPNPIKSQDPSKLLGYKLYRARKEEGSYEEIADLRARDLGLGRETDLESLSRIRYLDTNVVDGETYYYRTGAYNEEKRVSDLSRPVAGRCIPVVRGIVAQGDMIRETKVSWDAAVSEFVTGYVLYRSTSRNEGFEEVKRIYGRENNSYVDKEDLKDKTVYYYRVSLFEDEEKEGSLSNAAWAETKGPPAIPEGLRAKGGMAKRVVLAWRVCPEEEVGGYSVYRSTERDRGYERVGVVRNREKGDYLDKGSYDKPLDDNSTYYYCITSYNKVDVESMRSEVVCAATKPRPNRPSGLKGGSLHLRRVPLSWEPNPETDIKTYHIYRSSGEEEGFSEVAVVHGKTSCLENGLEDGREYRYKIRAEDKDLLLSDFSETIIATTKPKPAPPQGLNVAFDGGTMILTWSANSEPDIVSYHVFEKGFFGLKKIGIAKETRFVIVGPKPGKTKDYAVTGVDKDGLESEPSTPVSVFGR